MNRLSFSYRLLVRILLLFAAIIGIFVLLFFLTRQVGSFTSSENRGAHLMSLEAMYQENDLEGLRSHLLGNGLYDQPYQKYWDYVEATDAYRLCLSCLKEKSPREPEDSPWTAIYERAYFRLEAVYLASQRQSRALYEGYLSQLEAPSAALPSRD